MTGTAIVGAWFVITVGVAFLREAKALRWTRTALEKHDVSEAYNLISPFIEAYPNHREALYLAGSSAIKTDRPQEASVYYSRLASMANDEGAMERARRLETIYNKQIPVNAGRLPCGQQYYATFYGSYEGLGEKFHNTLVRSAAPVARKCVVSNSRRRANEPGYWLINEKKIDAEFVVASLYIEPLKPTLAGGQYLLAQKLAEQGISQWPQAKAQLDDIFSELRSQVAKTVEGIQDLCSILGKDPEFRQGRSTCFPTSLPATVTNLRDAWGNPVVYTPFSLNEKNQCYRGFELVSLGADARQTPADTGTPAMEITCRYEWGRARLKSPDRFWLPPK